MSTKIYNAWRFKGSFQSLCDTMDAWRQEWTKDGLPRSLIHYLRIEEGWPEEPLDGFEKQDRARDVLIDFSKRIRSRSKGPKTTLGGYLDIRGTVQVIPHRNRLYLICFTRAFDDRLEADPRFDDFHYQNQTDPWFDYRDEPLTDAERKRAQRNWRHRRKVWGEIFKTRSHAAQVGVRFELVPEHEVDLFVYWGFHEWMVKEGILCSGTEFQKLREADGRQDHDGEGMD